MPLSAVTPTESGAAKPARERLAQEELQPQEEDLEAQVKMQQRALRRRKENWAFGCSSSAALSF